MVSLHETLTMELGLATAEAGRKGTTEPTLSTVGGSQQDDPEDQDLSHVLLCFPITVPRSWHIQLIN